MTLTSIEMLENLQRAKNSNDSLNALKAAYLAQEYLSDNTHAMFIAGQIFRSAGRLREAWSCLNKAVKSEPGNQFGWHELGLTAIAEGDTNAVLLLYSEGLRHHPNELYKRYFCEALASCGFFQSAVEAMDEIFKSPRREVWVWNILISMLTVVENWHLVTEAARLALSEYPDDVQIRTQRVDALIRMKSYSVAADELHLVKLSGRGDIYVDDRERFLNARLAETFNNLIPLQLTISRFWHDVVSCFSRNVPLVDTTAIRTAIDAINVAKAMACRSRFTEATYWASEAFRRTTPETAKDCHFFLNCAILSRLFAPGTLGWLREGVELVRFDRVVQFWDKDPKPDLLAQIETWRSQNTEINHRLYNEGDARDFIKEIYGSELVEIYDCARHPAMKSDIFRIAYLYKNGGIYVDADEASVVPLKQWLKNQTVDLVLSLSTTPSTYVHNWFIAAIPGHPILKIMLQRIMNSKKKILENKGKCNIWETTGPGCMTMALLHFVSQALLDNEQRAQLSRIALISERSYRTVTSWRTDLEYRTLPGGDWKKA